MNSPMPNNPAAISIQNDRDSVPPTLTPDSENVNTQGSGVAGSPTCPKPLSSGVVDSAHTLEKSAPSLCWSRLPADILIVIVRLALVTAWFGDRDPHHDYMSVHASQVCRQWRAIVLNEPLLWNYIVMPLRVSHYVQSRQTLVFIRHLLRRSQSAMLEVKLEPAYGTKLRFYAPCFSDDAYDVIFRQMHRIRRLEIIIIRNQDYNAYPSVLNYLRQPAPRLESLNLWCRIGTGLPTPFRGYTVLWPALRDANICGFDIPGPWSAWSNSLPTFRSMVHLKLSRCVDQLPTASEVLRILDDCPDLVSLTLIPGQVRGTEEFAHYDFCAYAISSSFLPTVTHHRLQMMHCEMEFRELFQLFRSLSAPALDEWTLKSFRTPYPGAPPFLIQAMPPIQAFPTVSYNISGINIDISLKTSQSHTKGHFQARIAMTHWSADIIDSLTSLLQSSNMGQAIDVSISDLNYMCTNGTTWCHFLTASPNLRKISLATRSDIPWDSDSERLLDALMGVYDRDGGCATGVLQTSLQQLCIAGYLSDENLDKLVAFAVSRKRSGDPLSKVEIHLRESQWAWATILGDAVESLIVDRTRHR